MCCLYTFYLLTYLLTRRNLTWSNSGNTGRLQKELDSTGHSALPSPPRLTEPADKTWYKQLSGHTHKHSVTAWHRAAEYCRTLSGGEGNDCVRELWKQNFISASCPSCHQNMKKLFNCLFLFQFTCHTVCVSVALVSAEKVMRCIQYSLVNVSVTHVAQMSHETCTTVHPT